MNYELNIITRDMIPSNIYLCGKNDEKDWTKINYFEFDNGLECVIGANRYLSGKDAIESMKDELDYVLENNSPEELQQYFYDNFENFIPYSDCVKIFNYFYENKELIKEAYYTYFDKEESDNDEDMEEEIDDIIDDNTRDKIEKYIDKYTEKYLNKALEWTKQKVHNKVTKKIKGIDEKLVLF